MRIATDLATRVRFLGIKPEMAAALPIIDSVWKAHTGFEAVITSVVDGKHQKRSLHYKGYAVDLRTRDMPKSVQEAMKGLLKEALGPEFDVVIGEHSMHVEFDPEN